MSKKRKNKAKLLKPRYIYLLFSTPKSNSMELPEIVFGAFESRENAMVRMGELDLSSVDVRIEKHVIQP